jgi:PAS domain S-box-containing protein
VINSERALILAPSGRDGAVACRLLEQAGRSAEIRSDMADLLAGIAEGAGLAIIADEALQYSHLAPLLHWIETQPAWSDFPFIILTRRTGAAEQEPGLRQLQSGLGSVIFVERPFHPPALISVVDNALRGRRRQYQARQVLEDLRRSEQRLASERERTQEALRGERALSELLMTSVPAGIIAYDTNLRVTIWNPVMERVFGIPAAKAHGRQLVNLIGDGEREGIRHRLHDALSGVAGPIEEIELTTAAGQVVLETQHAPLRGGDGQIVGGAAFFREITDRRRAEEQLRQAQKMETIGQLTGGIAHDFNNLLAAIHGNLELLRKRLPNDPQIRRFIDGAVQGAERGASLTSRLLAFARRQDLRPEPTDLAQLLDGMRGLMERSIGGLIAIEFNLEEGLPPAKVDSNQLELAILNLAVNARDAMPDGGTLSISLARCDGTRHGLNGDFLCLSVLDTGIGMDAETLKSAIEPFFSTKELGKGTGLGLSMVHGLAIQLGGALRLESQLGKGTTAELWLPMSQTPVQPVLRAEMPNVEAPASTILVVDDDALIAMNTVDMVEDLGHTAVEAYSGKQALTILASGQCIDALITDYAMPGMTGVELALKARELRPNLPILLATGYADLPNGTSTDLPRLAKPYHQADLAQQLSRLLAVSATALS